MELALSSNNFLRLTALENLHKNENGDPFKILIGTILSSRTRDENTTKALIKLFKKFKGATDISKANIDDIKREISSVGFYNIKAVRVKEVANIIQNKFQGQVPDSEEELLKLPGVGRKTANCVLVYAFQKSAIPVDTHVHRISNRLGLVDTKIPAETERALSKFVDKKDWIRLNSAFVRYGQNICVPIKPKCEFCNLRKICKYYNCNYNNLNLQNIEKTSQIKRYKKRQKQSFGADIHNIELD
jgi:endonuclease-3